MNQRTVFDISADLNAGKTTDELIAQGASLNEVIEGLRFRAEQKNRASQATLSAPPSQPDVHWAERKAWLLDGQPIHGNLTEFFYPAFNALLADDQSAFTQQRDLIFKALRTFLGDPPTVPSIGDAPVLPTGAPSIGDAPVPPTVPAGDPLARIAANLQTRAIPQGGK